jgi:hypothetical protein
MHPTANSAALIENLSLPELDSRWVMPSVMRLSLRRWDVVVLMINGTIGAGIFALPSLDSEELAHQTPFHVLLMHVERFAADAGR